MTCDWDLCEFYFSKKKRIESSFSFTHIVYLSFSTFCLPHEIFIIYMCLWISWIISRYFYCDFHIIFSHVFVISFYCFKSFIFISSLLFFKIQNRTCEVVLHRTTNKQMKTKNTDLCFFCRSSIQHDTQFKDFWKYLNFPHRFSSIYSSTLFFPPHILDLKFFSSFFFSFQTIIGRWQFEVIINAREFRWNLWIGL